ncbi:MAG: SAM-dependent methyltransferase [Caulobacter sp.]|nr:SAM-dependent methyltransferase [Caulobacter sp.]
MLPISKTTVKGTPRMAIGGDVDYDSRGAGYARHRRADRRIATHIHAALGDARTVLNVGAGAGSYEPQDRYVLALEPSDVMRAQRPRTAAPAVRGVAGALPFDDGSFDAVMAVMTVHQWPDLEAGLAELRRASRGPVVVVAGNGERLERFWLNDYAPELIAAEKRRYPSLERIAARIGARASIAPIPIPIDCTDGLCEAFYGRPERLLDPAVRAAQSSWSFLDPDVEPRFVAALSADLASGRWDERHGEYRHAPTFCGSLSLVVGYRAET